MLGRCAKPSSSATVLKRRVRPPCLAAVLGRQISSRRVRPQLTTALLQRSTAVCDTPPLSKASASAADQLRAADEQPLQPLRT